MNQLSPGVVSQEIDNTGYIPGTPTVGGAIVGNFRWGPTETPLQLRNERELVARFGQPNKTIYSDFFTGVSYLRRASNLTVVRTRNDGALNSVGSDMNSAPDNYEITEMTITQKSTGDFTNYDSAIATDGAVIEVSISQTDNEDNVIARFDVGTASGDEAESNRALVFPLLFGGYRYETSGIPEVNLSFTLKTALGDEIILDTESGQTFDTAVKALFDISFATKRSVLVVGNIDNYEDSAIKTLFGTFFARYPGSLGDSICVYMVDRDTWTMDRDPSASSNIRATYVRNFPTQPDEDEVHILVIDKKGKFTGTENAVLESYEFLSKSTDGQDANGLQNHWVDVITSQSSYVWVGDTDLDSAFGSVSKVSSVTNFKGGADGDNPNRSEGWELFRDAERYNNINFFISGNVSADVASHIISIAEDRQDVVVTLSPNKNGQPIMETHNSIVARDDIADYYKAVGSSTYAFADSAFGQMRDVYNNRNVWIPLNGETAGLLARATITDAPWASPAGYNRGVYRNFSRLSYSPNKNDRDWLYPLGINPVIIERGAGTILFGDKTLTQKPSAFDRIGVRRLFIVVRRAIVSASKFTLFEQNDEITRLQYFNAINGYMSNILGRGGVYAYRVIVDETNNTPDVIRENQLVGDVEMSPSRSINYIRINFTATDNIVTFSDEEEAETTADEGIVG